MWERKHIFIPDVRLSYEHKNGKVVYYMTHVLSRHGCFLAYPHKFKHEDSSYYQYALVFLEQCYETK